MPPSTQLQTDLADSFQSFAGNLRHRPCPLCNHDNSSSSPLFPRIPWIIRQCTDCTMVYLENPPTFQALSSAPAWQQSWRDEKNRRARREPVFAAAQKFAHGLRDSIRPRDKLASLMRAFIPSGRVLDVGCGVGHRSRNFPPAVIPFGIEIEESAAHHADALFRSRGGFAVHAPALVGLDAFENASFDGLVMYAYLEHEIDPASVLALAAAKLAHHAPAIIKVPNFASVNRAIRGLSWCGFRLPEHVNYFTPHTLRTLLRKAGFRVRRFNLADRLPTSDNMWIVADNHSSELNRTIPP